MTSTTDENAGICHSPRLFSSQFGYSECGEQVCIGRNTEFLVVTSESLEARSLFESASKGVCFRISMEREPCTLSPRHTAVKFQNSKDREESLKALREK